MSSPSAPLSTPEGPGSASGTPKLPGRVHRHVHQPVPVNCASTWVIGGDGPPLLLVHGWPVN